MKAEGRGAGAGEGKDRREGVASAKRKIETRMIRMQDVVERIKLRLLCISFKR